MTSFLQDLRYALRQLRRSPVFSVTVSATIVLTVGATAALSGVLRATLLNRLPYPHAEQLVALSDENLRGFKTNGLVSVLRTEDLRHLTTNGSPLFADLGYFYSDDATLTVSGQTSLRVPAAAVSGTFFQTVATPALLGRTLAPADDVNNGPQVLVLSYRLWQTAFAGDPHVLGRSVHLGADQATIIGVMPPHFNLPAGIDLWHPGHIFPSNFGSYRGDGSRFVSVVGRLSSSASMTAARSATAELATRLAAAFPETDAAWGFTVTDLRTSLFGEYRQALLLLTAAVVLVLLAASVNIAGLQLSRNAARQSEFAVRTALGISRLRLARMLMVEALTPALGGSLLGVLLAASLLRLAASQLPPALLLVERPHIDLAVLALSIATGFVVGMLTAAIPVLQATRLNAHGTGRSLVGRTRMIGRGFSVMQIALALLLLTLSSAVVLNLYRLLTTPLGYDISRVQTFTVDLPWGAEVAKSHRLYAQLEDAFAAMPGVQSVGAISALPLHSFSIRSTFDVAGQPPTPNHDAIVAEGRNITPGYLGALHIPLLAGRNFDARDAHPNATPTVVLVNHAFAMRYFPNSSPIGKRLKGPVGYQKNVADVGEIVGVVGDVHGTGGALDAPVQPEYYYPEDGGWPHMQFALRTPLPGDSRFQSRIRAIVTAMDATASPGHFETLSATLDRSLTEPRLNAALLATFAALSLLLVVIGVYGLIAFDVAERTRELGLRFALGASRGNVLQLLFAESSRILGAGLLAGLAASWAAARLLSAVVTAPLSHMPLMLLTAAALLAMAVYVATLIPARRAAMVDPMQALRSE